MLACGFSVRFRISVSFHRATIQQLINRYLIFIQSVCADYSNDDLENTPTLRPLQYWQQFSIFACDMEMCAHFPVLLYFYDGLNSDTGSVAAFLSTCLELIQGL